jgi:hypothetical protein
MRPTTAPLGLVPGDYPQPDLSDTTSATGQALFTIAMVIATVAVAAFAYRYWRTTGSPIALLCMVGGLASAPIEAIVDLGGLCWYPREGQWRAYETFGRPIPVLVVFGYVWFMGGLMAIVEARVSAGATHRDVWRLYGGLIALNVVIETFGTRMKIYHYYGHQPLKFFGFPLWWAVVNTAVATFGGMVLAALRPHLTGARILVVIPLVPMIDAGVNASTAWPTWTMLNTDLSAWAIQLAGALTAGLCALLMWMATLLIPNRSNAEATPAVIPRSWWGGGP